MKILTIIVAYKNNSSLIKCLESVEKLNFNFDIVVVDNFGDVEKSEKYELIKPGKNLGFAGGVNVALRRYVEEAWIPASAGMTRIREYDWVWILNPDCRIEIKGELEEDKGINMGDYDIFSPVIYNELGEIWFGGGKLDPFTGEPGIIRSTSVVGKAISWVSGCSMSVKPQVFEKIGYFDENFFLFWEDVDFCLRAKKAGFKIGIIEEKDLGFRVIHKISESVKSLSEKEKYKIENKSKQYFLRKHWKEIWPSTFAITWARSIKHRLCHC